MRVDGYLFGIFVRIVVAPVTAQSVEKRFARIVGFPEVKRSVFVSDGVEPPPHLLYRVLNQVQLPDQCLAVLHNLRFATTTTTITGFSH